MMDHLASRADNEGALAFAPFRAAGKRQVKLLGNVVVVRIDDIRTKHQHAGRNAVVDEVSASTDELDPAVIVYEPLAEIDGCIGLPPAEGVAVVGKESQRNALCRPRFF